MQWQDLLVALALVMVWEGLMPSISPSSFRKLLTSVQNLNDKQLRMMGLTSMIAGAILVYIIKQW